MTNPLVKKYNITAHFYDILDYPWEWGFYRHMRPILLSDLSGKVLEAGVGTGKNLPYYPENACVVGIDLSKSMLKRATARKKYANSDIELIQADATKILNMSSNKFDWYISTFMYCVLPNELQSSAIAEMARIIKPNGRFRIVEMVYSKNPRLLWRQKFLEGFVEKVYGARFDRRTKEYVMDNADLVVTQCKFLKNDTYLLIEGRKVGK